MKTRSISMWRGALGAVFSVNPKELTITRTRTFKENALLSGETIVTPAAMQPAEVAFSTFLPAEGSPFYGGTAPETVAARIDGWHSAHQAVALYIDGQRAGNFYIKTLRRTFAEGDEDVNISLLLIEAPESAAIRSISKPGYVTAVYGDTLYSLARRYYGDGNKWKDISAANGGIKTIAAGQTVKLP